MNKFIDLHLHLDGAITLQIAKKLAEVQNIDLNMTDEELEKKLTVPADCTSLNDFLACFDLPVSLMQTKEGLSEAAYQVCENIRSQGVVYAEIRFAPQLHCTKGLTQEEVVKAVVEGSRRSSLKANIILCCMRGQGNESENLETIEVAKKLIVKDGGAVAVDLAGAEAIFKTKDYADLFKKVREYGLPYTIHAGEADGADSVMCAIEYGTKRIGHGVRAFEDEKVVELIKEKGIFLEMCPTSNRQTIAIPDMKDYPFMPYLKKGIKVTLNTDDMGISGIKLADEYKYMEETFGLSAEDEKIIINNSIDATFTTEEVKESLRKQFN